MPRETVSMQIRVSEEVRDLARIAAKKQGMTLSEYILNFFAESNDKDLSSSSKKELKERPKPGRPWPK